MLKEKNARLIQYLDDIIKKYSRNEKLRNIIMDEFRERNMKASNAVNILNERLELSTLDIDSNKNLILLFVFTVGMFKALLTLKEEENSDVTFNPDDLKLENYFTPIEIENLTDYKFEIEKQLPEKIVFHKMTQTAPKFWSGNISAKYTAELDAGNEFVYNFKTQRDPIIDVFGNKRIHLIKDNINDITNGLLSGEQFPTTIVINVLRDGTDDVVYNEKTGDLTIVSGVKNLVDGMHRKVGTSLAIEQNPDLDFNWLLVVTNYSEVKARKYMTEINKQQKMKEEHIKSMDTSNPGNVVVDEIRDIETSEFASKIKDNDKELDFGGLTKKSILSLAIEECYKNELKDNKFKIKPIAEYVADVMDYILALYVEDFIVHSEETKKNSYINHKNMFAGYVALSEKLFGDAEWEDKVEIVLKKINFSVDNNFWKDIGLTDTNMSKSTRKNLYKAFRDLV